MLVPEGEYQGEQTTFKYLITWKNLHIQMFCQNIQNTLLLCNAASNYHYKGNNTVENSFFIGDVSLIESI